MNVENFFIPIIVALVGSGITGAVTAYGVLSAMRVHIEYLKDGITRAHARIDSLN